ncbi:uncharacterized protein MONBRDRAFT_36614 [Monosiga brevicollis MX1]|uniref:Peptidase M12B domain-containing protein n=1 Tax=Monosiga brevicollis TaxID=81824 RepID=A9UWE9_MONBE|nr:uncharacterized protein MONBRDRAFT_36614 [Monosiga brevicollis MX1]EDQ90552.1 predicted protein [Monosiga brevicollis MX1]|eukprot:XP_001744603.1 hypothetical protein [Monosiga brevicollis MX1]
MNDDSTSNFDDDVVASSHHGIQLPGAAAPGQSDALVGGSHGAHAHAHVHPHTHGHHGTPGRLGSATTANQEHLRLLLKHTGLDDGLIGNILKTLRMPLTTRLGLLLTGNDLERQLVMSSMLVSMDILQNLSPLLAKLLAEPTTPVASTHAGAAAAAAAGGGGGQMPMSAGLGPDASIPSALNLGSTSTADAAAGRPRRKKSKIHSSLKEVDDGLHRLYNDKFKAGPVLLMLIFSGYQPEQVQWDVSADPQRFVMPAFDDLLRAINSLLPPYQFLPDLAKQKHASMALIHELMQRMKLLQQRFFHKLLGLGYGKSRADGKVLLLDDPDLPVTDGKADVAVPYGTYIKCLLRFHVANVRRAGKYNLAILDLCITHADHRFIASTALIYLVAKADYFDEDGKVDFAKIRNLKAHENFRFRWQQRLGEYMEAPELVEGRSKLFRLVAEAAPEFWAAASAAEAHKTVADIVKAWRTVVQSYFDFLPANSVPPPPGSTATIVPSATRVLERRQCAPLAMAPIRVCAVVVHVWSLLMICAVVGEAACPAGHVCLAVGDNHDLLHGELQLEPHARFGKGVAVFSDNQELTHGVEATANPCPQQPRWWTGRIPERHQAGVYASVRVTRTCRDACLCADYLFDGFVYLESGRVLALRADATSLNLTRELENDPATEAERRTRAQLTDQLSTQAQHCLHAAPHDLRYAEPDNADNASFPHPRTPRAGPASSLQTTCSLALDCDASFVAAWGGLGSRSQQAIFAAARMLDYMFQVDRIFQDEANLRGSFAIRINAIFVHHNLNLRDGGSDGAGVAGLTFLHNYQTWLVAASRNGSRAQTFSANCLNFLFSHENLQGVLGVAIEASPRSDILGGVCTSVSVSSLALNVGVSTTRLSNSQHTAAWQTVLSTTHEIGHTIGARHTCELSSTDESELCNAVIGSSSCAPTAGQGGNYIMYPAVPLDDTHANARLFSSCNIDRMLAVLDNKGSCLEEPHPCDVGSGSCCLGQLLLPQGAVCDTDFIDETGCLEAPVCDGSSATCPQPTVREDGLYCSTASVPRGTCQSGICVVPHAASCAALNLSACFLEEAPCVAACQNGTEEGGTCRPLTPNCPGDAALLTAWSDAGETCAALPNDMPCAHTAGDADSGTCYEGECATCDAACQLARTLDVAQLVCNVSQLRTTVCSVPCGGGEDTTTYACICNNGVEDVEVEASACNSEVPPAEMGTCRTNTCSVQKPESMLMDLTLQATEGFLPLDGYSLVLILQDIVGFALQGEVAEDSGSTVQLKLAACRRTLSGGCLSYDELASEFNSPAFARTVFDSTGYVYTTRRSSNNHDQLAIILAVAMGSAAGILLVAVVIMYLQFRRARRQHAQAAEARLVKLKRRNDRHLASSGLSQMRTTTV